MTVGLAASQWIIPVGGQRFPFMLGHLDFPLFFAHNERIFAELVVHERAQALAECAGQLDQHPDGRIHLLALDGLHQRQVEPRGFRQFCLRHFQTLAKCDNALAQ